MNNNTEKRLAQSLTASTTDIIEYLPYLLQDFWSLASDPDEMAGVLKAHTEFGTSSSLIDLACGKGAVAINLAKAFGCRAKGIDIMREFIDEAKAKAVEHGVSDRCTFVCGDVNEAVNNEQGYDLAVWGGSGDLLGGCPNTIKGIALTVKPGGYILFDDGYITEEQQSLRFHHDCLTKAQWEQVFYETGLTVIACKEAIEEVNPAEYADDLNNIRKRANELIELHPDKRELFEGYVKNQQSEYEDLQDGLVCALWLLQKHGERE